MKVEYQIAGGAGGYVVLFDEAAGTGDASPTSQFDFTDAVMTTPGFGSLSTSDIPMGNTSVDLNIPLSQVFASRASAKAQIRTFRTALKGVTLNLKFTQDADIDYYPQAVLKKMTAKLMGCSVEFNFSFTAQDVTATAPA